MNRDPLSTVGLLQARFTSGFLSHLADSPRPSLPPPSLSRASPVPVEPPRLSFLLHPRIQEPSIRTVGARRVGGPVALKESVTRGKVGRTMIDSELMFVCDVKVNRTQT